MAEVLSVGVGGACGRDLFVVEASGPDDVPPWLPLPCPYFVCLIAWDAAAVPDAEITALARRLLGAGCVYVVCWGPDCERVHDLFDRADLGLRPEGPYAMSTWHDRDSLPQALWFFHSCTFPDDAYADGCRAAVALTIESERWADEVKSALAAAG
jgi:hypothetical protein